MLATRPLALVACAAIAAGIIILWPRDGGGDDTKSESSPPKASPVAKLRTGSTAANHKMSPQETKPNSRPVREWDGPRSSAVNSLLDRWDELSAEKGADSLKARQALAQEALDTLGGGAALGAFIEGLHERRATDMVDWLIANGSKAMFSGKDGAKGREWLLGVADEKLRNRLAYEAGYRFTGTGLKDYLMTLTPPMTQDRFLTGYACGIAETDGFQAMKEFAELKPAKVTNYGMKEIMQKLPETTDFPKMSMLYPGDEKDLACEIRSEMLKRWAGFKPEDAAQYVLKNPTRAYPEQMKVVLAEWARTSPADAAGWIVKVPAGKARDQGMAGLARYWTADGQFTSAWSHVGQVADFDLRVKEATEVFKSWEKTDKPAATKAWLELFPGK